MQEAPAKAQERALKGELKKEHRAESTATVGAC